MSRSLYHLQKRDVLRLPTVSMLPQNLTSVTIRLVLDVSTRNVGRVFEVVNEGIELPTSKELKDVISSQTPVRC